jgi:transformation/transcription domain-associated protein
LEWDLPANVSQAPTRYRISHALLAAAPPPSAILSAAAAAAAAGADPSAAAAAAAIAVVSANASTADAAVEFSADIPAGGPLFAAVAGLAEGGLYALRAHSVNDATNRADPVGTAAVLARPAGDRAGFALRLGRPCASGPCTDLLDANCEFESRCPQAAVAPPGDAAGLVALQPAALTLEAWVRIDPSLQPDAAER